MKVSELIKELNEIIEREGDLEILKDYDGCKLCEFYIEDLTIDTSEDGEKRLLI